MSPQIASSIVSGMLCRLYVPALGMLLAANCLAVHTSCEPLILALANRCVTLVHSCHSGLLIQKIHVLPADWQHRYKYR